MRNGDISSTKIGELATSLGRNTSLVSRARETHVFFGAVKKKIEKIFGLYTDLIRSVKTLRHMTHEVEYTLDNFYILEGAVEDVLREFMGKEIKKLPQV